MTGFKFKTKAKAILLLWASCLFFSCNTDDDNGTDTDNGNGNGNGVDIDMVYVGGGTYQMGDWLEAPKIPAGSHNVKDITDVSQNGTGDHGTDMTFDARDLHNVTLSAFYISETEVTFTLFDRFCNETGITLKDDEGWGREDRPAIYVTWLEAVLFCNWLSEKNGYEKCYTINGDGGYSVIWDDTKNGYRLPTEAEWEYAARGGPYMSYGDNGHGNIFSGTLNDLENYTWYRSNSYIVDVENIDEGRSHPVKGKLPNELGLYDMSGNVWEWCWDFYDPDYYTDCMPGCTDPRGPPTPYVHTGMSFEFTYAHVLRGGSWGNYPYFLRNTFRFFSLNQVLNKDPDYTNWRIGFRVCRNG
jgi:sulfatase modifying factor 1